MQTIEDMGSWQSMRVDMETWRYGDIDLSMSHMSNQQNTSAETSSVPIAEADHLMLVNRQSC
jgi:hypothetical protein